MHIGAIFIDMYMYMYIWTSLSKCGMLMYKVYLIVLLGRRFRSNPGQKVCTTYWSMFASSPSFYRYLSSVLFGRFPILLFLFFLFYAGDIDIKYFHCYLWYQWVLFKPRNVLFIHYIIFYVPTTRASVWDCNSRARHYIRRNIALQMCC